MTSELHEYTRYPLTMAHPHFKRSQPIPVPGSQVYGANGEVVRQDYQGTPERLPPVTVEDEAHEEYYKAQGYEEAGKTDPSAWVAAQAGELATDEPRAVVEYPKWVGDRIVNSAEEEAELTGVPLVIAQPEPAQDNSELEALRARIAELELLKDKRSKPRKVQQDA